MKSSSCAMSHLPNLEQKEINLYFWTVYFQGHNVNKQIVFVVVVILQNNESWLNTENKSKCNDQIKKKKQKKN